MPAGRVLRIDPGRSAVHIERRGRPDTAPLATPDALDVGTQPFRVANTWLSAMSRRDIDGALDLYRPSTVIHTAEGDLVAPSAVRAALIDLGWPGAGANGTRIRGVDRFVLAEPTDGSVAPQTFFVIEGGDIVEQWIGVEPDGLTTAPEEPSVLDRLTVARRGEVPDTAVDMAREKVAHLTDLSGRTMLWGQVKLTQTSNPANDRASIAEVTLDFDGQVVRGHAAAASMPEAVDAVAERLRAKLDHLSDRERHKPVGLEPEPGEWRHGYLPSARTPWYDRPRDEREVVRHKSFAPDQISIDDALWDLALLDYDFFLFTEETTGVDCVVERTDGEAVIHGLADRPEDRDRPDQPSVEFSDRPVPVLPTSEAIMLLDNSGERFELFEHPATGRRHVIYRRYDGHYGLITPPTAEPAEPAGREGEG